jgi:hypothetical protein
MAYQNKMGSGGAMFGRQKKTSNSPDVGGDFDITGDELAYVVANAHTGTVKLEISGWRKQGQKGPFTSLAIQIPYSVRVPQQTAQTYGQPMAAPQQRIVPQRFPPEQERRPGYPPREVPRPAPQQSFQRPLQPAPQRQSFEDFAQSNDLNDDIPF